MISNIVKHKLNKKIAFSLAVLVLAISMAISLNPSKIGAQPQQPSFRDVVIFATNSIDLKEGVVIQSGGPRSVGDIVVNDAGSGPAVELMVGVGATTSAGSNIFANSIRIQNRADVGSDVFYNELENNGSIGGSTHTPLSLPVFGPGDIPAFLNGTPDDSNVISVRQNQSLNIPPGNYGNIDVKKGGSIIFSGMGIYNIRSLNTGPGANVLFDAAGEVEVRVVEDFITGQDTTVGPVSGAIIDASDIIFYVAGDGPGGKGTPVTDFGKDGHIIATIYVKEGKLTLRNGTLAQGAFFATDVVVGSGAIIQFDSFFGNEPPDAADDAYSTNEDTPLNIPAPGVLANDTDADSDPISVDSYTQPSFGTVTVVADGSFTYTPDPNFNGTDDFTYTISDGNGGLDTATVILTVIPVNDPPQAVDDEYTTDEDTTLNIPAPGVLVNDTDVEGDAFTAVLDTTSSNGTLSLNTDGSFTYTPDANFNGVDSFTYYASDSLDNSNIATVTLNVSPVNDLPVADDDEYTTGEDTPLDVSPPGILGNDIDIDGDSLTAVLDTTSSNGTLSLNTDGSFTYTPDANFNGVDSFTYYASDSLDNSNIATVTLNVSPVNDLPVADDDEYTTNEDSALSVFAPGVLNNDNDPEGDTLIVAEVNGSAANIGITITLPSGALLLVSSDGNFVYDPNGQFDSLGTEELATDSFDYGIADGNGGADTATVTITITGVNDAPIAAAKNIAATGNVRISVPDGEDDLLFGVTDPDTSDTHTVSSVSGTSVNGGTVVLLDANAGTFSYNPPPGFEGMDTFDFEIADGNGGIGAGTVTFTVSGIVVFIDGSVGVAGDGRLTTPLNSLAAFEAVNGNGGSADPKAGDSIFMYSGDYSGGVTMENNQILVGQGATDTLSNITGINFAAYSDPLPSTGGTRPVITNASGNGVTLKSNNTIRGLNIGNTTGGEGISGSGVGTLTVNEVIISGTEGVIDVDGGTLDVTFDSLEVSGGASTGINLANVTGNFIVTGTTSISSNSGISITSSPVMTCTFGGGMAVTSTAGDGLVVDNAGNVIIGGLSSIIDATGGAALHVSGTSLSSGWTFSALSSNGGTNGIYLQNITTGDLNASGGTIQNSTGHAFHVDGGNTNINYSGAINNTTGDSVVIVNRVGGAVTLEGNINDTGTGISVLNNSGGSVTFSGGSKVLNTGSDTAVLLNSNTGATISFTGGGLDIDTTSGSGFNAMGGATGVNVVGSNNTIYTTTGIALNATNTDIGSSGLTFQSISAGIGSGSSGTGILLNNTGTSGGLTVTGDGSTAGSGGTIQRKAGSDGSENGVGIWLNQTQDVSLSFMQLNDFENFAIRGTDITNFALDNSTINGSNGNSAASDEGSVSFENLFGSANFTNSNISGGLENNIVVINDTGTLNPMFVTGMNIGANDTSLGNDGVLVEAQGSATVNITVEDSTFTSARGDLFQANGLGTSTMDVVFTNNTLSNNHPNIVSGGGGATFSGGSASSNINYTYEISGNTFRDAVGNAITVNFVAGSGTVNGTIQNNDIGASGVVGSGSLQGSGISVGAAENVSHTALIESNTIVEVKGWSGIDVVANVDVSCNFTILNNSVTLSDDDPGNFAFSALYTMVGGTVTDTGTVNFDIEGNVFNASGAPFAGNAVYMDQISTSANYNLPGYTGSANGESAGGTASADIAIYLLGRGNMMTNGPFPSFPGGIDAGIVSGVTGTP